MYDKEKGKELIHMTKHVVITIGRQFGSGGHEIGSKLAEQLGIPFYDRDLVKMAAEKLNITDETAEEADESDIDRFLAYYTVAPINYASTYISDSVPMQTISDKMYDVQSEIIRRLAEKSSCVIVGRCADYILEEYPGLISVFLTATKEDRKKRIARRYNLTERKAAEKIRHVDRERRYYYERYTGKEWGDTESHQMILNVSMLGIDGVVEMLKAIYQARK